jgi:5-carboxymethyl-2-hydroxymuconate isomerase
MPHLTLEYTDNLPSFNAGRALLELNRVLVASGQFEEADIKSRAVPLGTYLVGTSPGGRGFVHVKLALLSGRPAQTKLELSQQLLFVLKQVCEWPSSTHVQLCVEIREIERETYTKTVIGS